MIAMAAAMRLQSGKDGMAQAQPRYSFDVKPRWPLAELS
jgi:N6-L-threonylcarbamoyladenine synthase